MIGEIEWQMCMKNKKRGKIGGTCMKEVESTGMSLMQKFEIARQTKLVVIVSFFGNSSRAFICMYMETWEHVAT